jgi:hypothetical protein
MNVCEADNKFSAPRSLESEQELNKILKGEVFVEKIDKKYMEMICNRLTSDFMKNWPVSQISLLSTT